MKGRSHLEEGKGHIYLLDNSLDNPNLVGIVSLAVLSGSPN